MFERIKGFANRAFAILRDLLAIDFSNSASLTFFELTTF